MKKSNIPCAAQQADVGYIAMVCNLPERGEVAEQDGTKGDLNVDFRNLPDIIGRFISFFQEVHSAGCDLA